MCLNGFKLAPNYDVRLAKKAAIKTITHTHTEQKNQSRQQVQSDICHQPVIKAPLPPDQTEAVYQQDDSKLRITKSVKCYNVSETFHPVARCYYTLRHSKHSETPQTGETFTSAPEHTQTLTRDLRSGSSAVKPARA